MLLSCARSALRRIERALRARSLLTSHNLPAVSATLMHHYVRAGMTEREWDRVERLRRKFETMGAAVPEAEEVATLRLACTGSSGGGSSSSSRGSTPNMSPASSITSTAGGGGGRRKISDVSDATTEGATPKPNLAIAAASSSSSSSGAGAGAGSSSSAGGSADSNLSDDYTFDAVEVTGDGKRIQFEVSEVRTIMALDGLLRYLHFRGLMGFHTLNHGVV